jgi:adenine deaminase
MKVMMRYGSAWHDVAAQAPAVTEQGLDPRHFILVTDDSHSGTLVKDGHMDRVVRRAIEVGVAPLTAIQMATLNTAEHFGVAKDLGQIAPGRYADVLFVQDLERFEVERVIAKGEVVAESGQLLIELPAFQYPDEVKSSIHLGKRLSAADFVLSSPVDGPVTVSVIGVIENQAPTRHLKLELVAEKGEVHRDLKNDLAKVALVERHQGTGEVQVGLVQGFGFDVPCAIASTVAHDSHHMIVVGTNEDDMALAANNLAEVGGGQIVVKEGKTLALVELPIAGLMSNAPATEVAQKAEEVLEGFRQCGCTLNNANMQLSLLALVVIPALRISDKGLVDVETFEIIPVIEPVGSEH